MNTEGSDRLAHILFINCGRALAQAVDEQDLLQSVCNTLVNNCGFRLAWFGLTEPDSSNSIRIVAQAGDQDGFLQEPRCSETPATLAIQAGETCWIKAIADSPLVVPIRAAALKRGYTSVVSLPLKSDGTLFGALTIYADDPGKLDEPIVTRLREWSDLFALRIKRLRSHQERDVSRILKTELQNIADSPPLENRLRLIIDTTPALIHTSRPDGYLDYFNKPWLEYLGVTLEDVEGWKWTASIHPDDVTGIVDKWRACLASGEIFEYETRVRRADGEYRRMLHRKVPLRDQDGNVVKWYGSSIDIEEIKRAEEELRRSEAYLAEAQRLTHAGSWAYKPDLDRIELVHCSDELFRIYGFDPEEHVPTLEELRNRIHPEDRDRVRQNREKQFREKGEFVDDYRIVLPDGAVRHVHVIGHPILPETGDLVEYVGTAMDVTERKRAEEAVLRSEKELRNVIETIPISVWTALPDGTVDFVSRHWREHSDLSEENASGAGWQTALDPDDMDRHLEKWRASLATGAPFENEARRRAADGEYRWFLARAVPLRDEQGNILKWYGITMEIEDRKRAEEQLRRSAEELQRSESYLAEGQRLAHMGSWAFDAAGFDYWSPELFRMHGLEPASKAPTVQEYLDCVHPQDRGFMAELIKRILAEPSRFDTTKRIVRPDGEVRYIRCVGTPVVENQALKKFVGTAIDVTEYELLTLELHRREAYLTDAQRLSHTGSFGWRPASGEIVWSDETYRIFEYDRAIKPTMELVVQRVHPEDRVDFHDVIDRASRGATHFEHAYRLLLPDGRVKHVHALAHALEDASGNCEFVGAVMDVTERKRAEEAVLRSEKELRNVIDTIPAVVWSALPDGSNTYVNRRFVEYSGMSGEQMAGSGWQAVVHPDDLQRHVGKWRASVGTGEPHENELRFRGADGQYRWHLDRGLPLRDEQGNILKWYGITMEIEDRKRAEEAVRASEHRFRLAVESIPGLIAITTAKGQLEVVNGQVLNYFGKTLEELKSWDTTDLVHPDDLPRMLTEWKYAFETEQPYDSEHRLRRADGVYRWFHNRGLPLHDDEGRIVHWYHLLTDIDDRKNAEEKLRRSEASLLDAQRLSRTGSWTHDLSSGTVTISPEAVRMWGIQTEDNPAVTDFFFARMHPDDRLRVEQAYREAYVKKADFESEFRIVLPDGTIKNIHSVGHPIVSESGDIVEFVGAAIDITERKQAEQRLIVEHTVTEMLATAATLEEVTPKILQTVCELLFWDVGTLWTIDREAGVLRCAEVWHDESVEVPQFEAICRQHTFMPGVGLPGRVWSSHEPAYIPDVVHDINFPRSSIAAREGLHAAFGFPILLGADVLGVIEFFSHEIRQPDQELLDMMATLGSQISQFIERKRAEEAFRTAQMELAHVTRVATLGEMTASIAHEINQPLGALVNNAGACSGWLDAENLEEARNSVALMMDDAQRASEIITRIRALVKKAPPQRDWLDINQIIREVIGLGQSEVQRNHVALETQLSDDMPLVFADRIQLQQVMLNLMMNAIEAISGAADGPRELLVRSGPNESQGVLVSVQDSGPGLDPKSVDHLFDAFYTTKPHGLGMGLAISRSLIEAHGGRLWAAANTPHGAVFQFTLPIGSEKVS